MIERAVKEWGIDLASSWLIGDTTRDIETGRRAGIRTILVNTGDGGKDTRFFKTKADYEARDLRAAVAVIARSKK